MLRAAIRETVRGQAPWPLFVYGPAGSGKTCAALALLDYSGGFYASTAALADLIIQAQHGRLQGLHVGHPGWTGIVWPHLFWERIIGHAALVVLDELGAREKVSDHQYECVKRAIDERHGRPMYVASNHDLEAIAKLYDDRIASRLAGGTVVKLEGEDRRLE